MKNIGMTGCTTFMAMVIAIAGTFAYADDIAGKTPAERKVLIHSHNV